MNKYLVILAVVAAACHNGATGPSKAVLSASADTLAFGTIAIGSSSAPETLTVTNTGGTAATGLLVLEGGPDGQSYITNTGECVTGLTLPPGSACRLMITFRPISPAGEKQIFIGMLVDSNTVSVAVAVTGTAVSAP